ncbi:MAG: helix-turn-helix domain-containing protein [Desulfovibrio sp.]
MKTQEAAKLFEALSSDVRLDIFRLLVKHAPEGLVAGEIARQLDLPSTNLSFHLKAIVHTGLVSLEKEGRFSRYRANIPLMLDVITYLTAECCAAHPEHCQSFRDASAVPCGVLPQISNAGKS